MLPPSSLAAAREHRATLDLRALRDGNPRIFRTPNLPPEPPITTTQQFPDVPVQFACWWDEAAS